MKTLSNLLVVASLLAMPLCLASAAPLVDAGPADVNPAELSLPGLAANVTLDTDAPAIVAKAKTKSKEAAVQVKRLHPSQLSLEGELVEDVLAPSAREVSSHDVLACGR